MQSYSILLSLFLTVVALANCEEVKPCVKSYKDMDIHQEIGQLIEEAVKLTLEKILYTPPGSCEQLAQRRPDLPPGYYWIKPPNGTDIKIYCSGTWSRIGFINMTDPMHECPSTWREIKTPKRTCSKIGSTYTCSSATFATHGLQYNQVKGRIIGYQHGRTYAFSYYKQKLSVDPSLVTIDTHYLDGVSITHGNPRKHIWSFASNLCESCKLCDVSPPWVGDNYFCESGTTTVVRPPWPEVLLFPDDPLWDGKGCGLSELKSCTHSNPPWFTTTTDATTTDDIEVRICGTINTTVDTPVELVELYVQ